MAATPRPTSCTRTNRENLLVTRHGLRSPHVETPSFRPTPRCTPFARIRAETLTIARTDPPIHAPPDEKSLPPRSRRPYGDAGDTIGADTQNQKSP
jgi:hypothetical protein